MPKRGLCCRPLSVRLSVTLVDCIHTAKDIVKLLSQPGSTIILVFSGRQHWYPIPRVPLQRGRKIQGGWENFCDFRLNSRSISETVRDRPMVGMER